MKRPIALLLLALSLCAAASAEEWTSYDEKKGATFQKRPVAGSSYNEYRATIELAVGAEAAAATIWSFATDPASTKTVRKRVLKTSPDEVVIYQQMFLPTVSDRDVTLRLFKVPPAADGSLEMRWEAANALGPAPERGFVRMPSVRGSWTVKPSTDGKVRVVFVTHSEPGGAIPAVFVRGPQRDRVAVDFWNGVEKISKP
jgi:hypothetical protein